MPIDQTGRGVVTLASRHSVTDVLARLQEILQSKGITVFAVVDHSGEAAKAGLKMPNTKLVIFGSPKAGTPLMLAVPTIALDLPLKLLIWEDADAKTWISYNDPEFVRQRFDLPAELATPLAGVSALADAAGH